MVSRPIVLVGSGDLNRRVAQRLLATGHAVRLVSRHPDPVAGCDIRAASVTDRDQLAVALADADGVVIALESATHDGGVNGPTPVHHHGTVNVLAVAPAGAPVVLVTQIYMTRPDAQPGMRNIIDARRHAETAVRASRRPYVIVRPSWLTNTPGGRQAIRLEQGDTGEGHISRDDVASLIATALDHATLNGVTFEAFNAAGPAPPDLVALLAALQPDRTTPQPEGAPPA